MLISLSIQNIVLIESISITFGKGFCVFTGETGAGKSILLDSLGLALGKRAEVRLVRSGQKNGFVIAEFCIDEYSEIKTILAENAIDDGETLLLKRIIYADGKSKAFINDVPVSRNLLKTIAEQLIEIHGQHDQKSLLSPSSHANTLDEYGLLQKDVELSEKLFTNWREKEKEYESVKALAKKASEDEEYLRHVLEELLKLDPKEGEEENLADKRKNMMMSEKISKTINDAIIEITQKTDVINAIRSAEKTLVRSIGSDSDIFDPAIEALDRASIEVEDVISIMENTLRESATDEKFLDDVEERLFALRAAARKHNKTVDELVSYMSEIADKINLIEFHDEQIKKLYNDFKKSEMEYISHAMILRKKRKKAATEFEKALSVELSPLKMQGCTFRVEMSELEKAHWNAKGCDKIIFTVSTNTGSAFGVLGKIASGGELSRFMLAFKAALCGVRSLPTMIFDEIDSGIGGAVSDAVGKRLKRLSEGVQVLCVTHQPQVASYANQHLRIEKKMTGENISTSVYELSSSEQKEEIARMLAGENITDEARAAASKLIGTQ